MTEDPIVDNPLFVLLVGYKSLPANAKRMYAILYSVAGGFRFAKIFRGVLVELAGISMATVKTTLSHLREAELITIQHTAYPASPVVYQLIPPDTKNADYVAYNEYYKSKIEGVDMPSTNVPSAPNVLPILNIIPTENLWLEDEIEDLPIDKKTKPISQWTVIDFVWLLSFLFFKEYKVDSLEFRFDNGYAVGMIKNTFVNRFHKRGLTNEDCLRYIIWVFGQAKEKWLTAPIGLGFVISDKMQQRWMVMRKQERKEEKKRHHVVKEKVRETCKEKFDRITVKCLKCSRYDECSAAASM
jgi:hypothetical protein